MDGENYIVALDQGTTSCRAIIFSSAGNIISSSQQPIRQYYPRPGWVEHDPEEILKVQISVLQDAVAESGIGTGQIAAIGLTNQRETLVVWDRHSGRPIYPAIVWQCRRTAGLCQSLIDRGMSDEIRRRTGLQIDAYFSATKLMWILANVDGAMLQAKRGDLLAGTIDSWLIWHLSGRKKHVTDYSNASRTMMFNINELAWDKTLLSEFAVPQSMLPDVVVSSGTVAVLDSAILPGEIPIAGVAGDQQAALFGQNCLEPGLTKNTYGTGCFILMQTGGELIRSRHGLLSTIAWDIGHGPCYALEGSVFNAGSAVQWLRDELGIISRASECDRLAEAVPDTAGVHFVPAFTGLGAPHWNMQARGMICGLTRGSNREHIARAVLESIAFQSLEVLECMQADAGREIPVLRVDGGASVSEFLMQFQADISGLEVDRPQVVETTAFGAACLAGLATGVFPDAASLADIRRSEKIFKPAMLSGERSRRRAEWQSAVAAAIMYGSGK